MLLLFGSKYKRQNDADIVTCETQIYYIILSLALKIYPAARNAKTRQLIIVYPCSSRVNQLCVRRSWKMLVMSCKISIELYMLTNKAGFLNLEGSLQLKPVTCQPKFQRNHTPWQSQACSTNCISSSMPVSSASFPCSEAFISCSSTPRLPTRIEYVPHSLEGTPQIYSCSSI